MILKNNQELKQKDFKNEKELQTFFENNIDTILGYKFIDTEFIVGNFRIDSLAFDEESKSFRIIEYKNVKNYSLVDQGYTYLKLMLERKADFVLQYNIKTKSSLTTKDIDWSQSRIIFVSPIYTAYQLNATDFKNIPIDLVKVTRYEGNIIEIDFIKKTSNVKVQDIQMESIQNDVNKEIIVYTEEDHLSKVSDDIRNIYEKLKNRILELDDIDLEAKKLYIAFKGSRNITDIEFHKNKLKVYINMKKGSLNDPLKITKDISNTGHWGNGDYCVTIDSEDEIDTGNAMMARLNYNFNDRYLFTASFRRDGYSAFGENNPYANFPAFAFAWRISEEKFLKSISWIDNLKLRLSWGINGNRSIGRYAALANLDSESYLHDGNTVIGIYATRLPNKDLKWEKTEAYNIGLDFNLFNNRLNGTIEAYYMSTKDLLLTRSLPDIIGFSGVTTNLGEVRNKGFELTLNSVNIDHENFKWSSSLIASLNRNEIAHLYGEMVDILDEQGNIIGQREDDDIQNGWYIGHALDEIYDYKILGVWQENEREEAARYGKEPGDFKIWDVNNDGQYLPEDDKVFQGYRKPRFSFGIGNTMEFFKCIDFSFFIRSDLGHKSSNSHYAHSTDYYYDRINAYKYDYWTPENPTNEFARLGSNTKSPSFNVYKSRSFVRLQEISIAYRIPNTISSKWNITNARVYLNISNPLLITDWNYWDPESLSPAPRTFTLGINFTL